MKKRQRSYRALGLILFLILLATAVFLIKDLMFTSPEKPGETKQARSTVEKPQPAGSPDVKGDPADVHVADKAPGDVMKAAPDTGSEGAPATDAGSAADEPSPAADIKPRPEPGDVKAEPEKKDISEPDDVPVVKGDVKVEKTDGGKVEGKPPKVEEKKPPKVEEKKPPKVVKRTENIPRTTKVERRLPRPEKLKSVDDLMRAGDKQRRSNPKKAAQYYLKALEARPGYSEAAYKVGECYFQTGALKKAIPYFRTAIERSHFRSAYARIAQSYARTGDRTNARKYLKLGLQQYPGDALMESLLDKYK